MIDISKILQEAASNIASAAISVEEAMRNVRRCSLQIESARAKAILKYKGEAKNQMILEAMVTQDDEVILFQDEMLEYHGALAIAKLRLKEQEDLFISARKLASLSDEERKYQNDSYVSRKLNNV